MSGKIWTVVIVVVLAGLLGGANPAAAQTKPDTVPKPRPGLDPVDHEAMIVSFAMKNKDKVVGGGQCTDLVSAALEYAGMKGIEMRLPTEDEKKAGLPGLPGGEDGHIYSWGTKVRGVRRIYRPGYIIQFENCHFANAAGLSWTMPHHTAIVKSANGSFVTLLHQTKGSPVMESSLDLAWLKPNTDGKSSSIQLFAPVKK
jgi:hypothetical protein